MISGPAILSHYVGGQALAQRLASSGAQETDKTGSQGQADQSQATGTAGKPQAGAPANGSNQDAEVVVIGHVPTVKSAPGVTEYDVSQNLQAQTGSAADVLNTLPSVTVSSDGEVSVRGRTDVEILVDGRRSAAMNASSRGTTLQTMSGSNIESIEVVSNPSVSMESGGATVINLKLKKDEALGPRAAVSGNIDHRRRGRISLDSSYGWRDVKLNLNASYRENLRLDGYRVTRSFLNPAPGGIAQTLIDGKYTPTRSHAGNVDGKLQYTLSNDTEIGTSVNYTRYVASNLVNYLYTDFDAAGQVLSVTNRLRDARLDKHDGDASLYLTRKGILKDGTLEIVGDYGSGQGRSDRTFRTTPGDVAEPVRLTYVGNYTDYSYYRTTVDLTGTITEYLSFKAGALWQRSNDRYRTRNTELPLSSPFPSGFVGIPSDFRVAREDFNGSLEATFKSNDWIAKGGLKWRHNVFDLKNGAAAPFLVRTFEGIDASLSLERQLEHGKVSFSLSRLRQLPGGADLNPTVIVVDDLNRNVGNPDLRPQKAIRGELRYDTRLEGMKIAATLYYRATQDPIVFVYETVDQNVIQRSKFNAKLQQEYGLELSGSGKILPDLKIDLSGNVYRAENSFDAFGESQRDSLITYNAKAAFDWSFSDADDLRLDARKDGPSLLVQGRRSDSYAVSAVWKHIFSSDLDITVAAQQFLQSPYIITDYASPSFFESLRRDNSSTAFQIGVKWKIR